MDLKTTKKVIWALAVVSILFMLFAFATENSAFLILTGLATVALVGVNILFWRCPCCGEHLGRDVCRYCTHCGHKLEL